MRDLRALARALRRRLGAALGAGPPPPPPPLPIMAATGPEPEPSLTHPVSQACTAAQFEEAVYRAWCAEIGEPPRSHRKQWEFCYILQALSEGGMLAAGGRGLGFGVGEEPLTAVFAARGVSVVATDLGADEAERAGWVDTGQHAAQAAALNRRGLCDPRLFAERVTFRVADMNAIPADLGDFDFTWSACALEHLGSIARGLAFIENSLAVLRPGGIAVHTTEFNCASDTDTLDHEATVLFRRRDLRAFAARLIAAGHRITLNFNIGDRPLDRHIDVAPFSDDRHLKLRLGAYVTTSFGLIVRKAP